MIGVRPMRIDGGGQGAGSKFLARAQRRNSGAQLARRSRVPRSVIATLWRVCQIERDLGSGRIALARVDLEAMQDDLLQPTQALQQPAPVAEPDRDTVAGAAARSRWACRMESARW
jgi:hypothetical protein